MQKRAGATLHVCDTQTNADGVRVWEWPGGSHRKGNTVYARPVVNTEFNSRPWIITGTLYGQRWVYGELIVAGGEAPSVFGWIGRNYLHHLHCYTSFFNTSNGKIAGTSRGERFTSNPSFTSAKYRGQHWVWGKATNAKRAGWVGRNWLTKNSCSSGACHYTIKQSGINEWYLPGGADGP